MPAANPNQAEIDKAAAAKALWETQSAAANAKKAAYEADAAALRAKFGDAPSSGYTGTADAATNAGGTEATLLGAKALNRIAAHFDGKISEALKPASVAPSAVRILMFGSASYPDFLALAAQQMQYEAFQQAVVQARSDAPSSALAKYANLAVPRSIAAVGLGLDALNKILAFAKTDYKFANVDVASTDAMLLGELAGKLSQRKYVVELPYSYMANLTETTNPALKNTIEIYGWGAEAKQAVRSFQTRKAAIEKQLVATPDEPHLKTDLQTATDAVATWATLGDAVDAWNKTTTTPDDKGATTLATVLRQAAIKQVLANGAALLIVQVHKVSGTTYTKKNMLSSIGKDPFFVMGGALAGYTLFDGKTGRVLSSELVPAHGGYYSVDDLKSAINDSVK